MTGPDLRHLAAIVESSTDAIASKTLQGVVTSWNPAAERLFGYTAAEMIGKPITILFPPERLGEEAEFMAQIAAGRRVEHFETVRVRKDGTRVHVSITLSPIVDETGEIVGVSKIVRDLTERHYTAARLAEAELGLRRLAAIVESSDDAIVSKTLQGIIRSWNPGAERIFGYTADEAIGQPITMLFPADRIGEEAAFIAQISEGRRIDHYETRRVRKDGAVIDVSVTLSGIRDASGRIIGVSKIARDITDRKRFDASRAELLEREQDARQASDEAHRIKDDFLATLSHELRTPVNAIMGWARIIRSGQVDPESFARGLEVIERNARLQVDLVSDLLDMSRIITGRMRLAVSVIDAATVLTQAVDAVRPAALAKELTLDVSLPAAPVPIWADASRLQQVCWNLLMNAVKFTAPRGRVEASLAFQGAVLELRVSDSGVGIAPELLPHVFDRFRQGDSSTTRLQGGLGLGLAIVRHIVELHGGTVHAQSLGEEKGATFIVRLPSANVWSPTDAPSRPVSATALAGVRVLVVDDEEDARVLVAQVLQSAGAEVTSATNADEALEAFRRQEFDAIVADLAMPGMDGYAMIRELRSIEDRRGTHTPALALTALAQQRDRQQAIAAGYARHVAKPVDPLSLPEIIADLLSSSSLSGA